MVDRFFFCATLTVRRGGYTPFVQAGVETSDTGTEGFKPDTLIAVMCVWSVCAVCEVRVITAHLWMQDDMLNFFISA